MSKDYKKMLKEIRPYVKFKYNLNKLNNGQKANITKYHEKLFGGPDDPGILNQSHKIFRLRNKERIERIKKYGQLQGLNQLKVYPVHVPDKEHVKLKWSKNNDPIIETKHIKRFVEYFKFPKVIKDTESEIKRILEKYPDVKSFRIMTGNFETNYSVPRNDLLNEILRFIFSYKQVNKWMFGVIAFAYTNQTAFKAYTKEFGRQAMKNKAKSKKIRRSRRQTRKGRN